MQITKNRKTAAIGGAVAAAGITAGVLLSINPASANPTPGAVTPVGASEFTVCAKNSNNVPVRIYASKAGCSAGYHADRWEASGGKDGAPGKDAVVSLTTVNPLSADGTVLTHIGGTISSGITPVTQAVTLQPGTYQVTAYADFSRKAGTGQDNPAGNGTYGTLVVWGDKNNDGVYDWQNGEQIAGTAQTGALPITPTGSIEQSTSINDVFTLTEPTKVLLGGFGYNSNTGSYGTVGQPGAGDFSVLGAHANFVQLNVPASK